MAESVEVQRLRHMLKSGRSLLRELMVACARVEEELDRNAALCEAQPEEAQPKEATREHHEEEERRYCAVA